MDTKRLCMGCMEDKGDSDVCPRCGWKEGKAPESPAQLRPRTILNNQYLLGGVLGQGDFGITYLAWDMNLERKIAIKEYFPSSLATRRANQSTITIYSERRKEEFTYGLSRFLEEGKNQAKLQDHPGIVPVIAFFKANDTGYLVMEYKDKVDDLDSNKMTHVTCQKCWTKNEIPSSKPMEEVSCKKCGTPLALPPKADVLDKKMEIIKPGLSIPAVVTCPKCWTKNEFPSSKPMEELSCKKCGAQLAEAIERKLKAEQERGAIDYKGVKGSLLFFCIYLTMIGPLVTICNLIVINANLVRISFYNPRLKGVLQFDMFLAVGIMIFSITAGVFLWSKRKNAVVIAKRFLITWLIIRFVELFIFPLLGGVSPTVDSVFHMLLGIIYFSIWFSYLKRSRRVKATYGGGDE